MNARLVRKDGAIVPFEICRYPEVCTHGDALQTENKLLKARVQELTDALAQTVAVLSDSSMTPKYQSVRQKRADAILDGRAALAKVSA